MCSLSHGECVVSPMRARRVKLPYKGTLPIWIWDVDVDVNEHIKINPKWILYKNINFCAIIEFGNGFTFAISIFRSKITWSRISPRGHADWTGCQKESSESKFKVNRFLYKFECRRVGDERKNSSQIRWTFLSSLFVRNYYKFFEPIHPLNGSACQVHTHWVERSGIKKTQSEMGICCEHLWTTRTHVINSACSTGSSIRCSATMYRVAKGGEAPLRRYVWNFVWIHIASKLMVLVWLSLACEHEHGLRGTTMGGCM